MYKRQEEYGIQPFAYSGWGATLRYDFAKDAGQVITMARISPDCSHMMIAKGTIVGGGGVDSQNCSLSVIFTVDKMCIRDSNYDAFYAEFKKQKEYLDSSRPTAVNLSWALNRMEQVVLNNADKSVAEIKQLLKEESVEIQDEDIRVCKACLLYTSRCV